MGGENRAQGRQSLGQVQCGEASPLLLIWHGEGAEPPGGELESMECSWA